MDRSLTSSLAEFALNAKPNENALAILRLSFLDWLSVALAGQDEPVAKVLRTLAEQEGGTPSAFLFGTDKIAPPRMAAMVNGTIGHALDYDDTHFAHIGHPSAVILPAVLAIAQSRGCDGVSLQKAALIGVEASIRIGLWLGRTHYQDGFHQTATAGAFGAGLAIARLLGFSQSQAEAVLGLLSTRVSGLKSQFGSMGKPFNAGLAASNAVEAALLIECGFEPNSAGLETEQGFGATHSGENNLADALEGLGQKWLFETVSHKYHACCHGLHAALEAFQPLRGRAEEIDSILVRTNPRWLRVCNIASPQDGLETKFSYRHVLAMAAHGQDTAGIGSYTVGSAKDARLVAFRDKVSVTGDATFEETATQLEVGLKDGSVQVLEQDLNAPIGYEEKANRIIGKSSALIGADPTLRLHKLIEGFATADEITAACRK